ncbi:hypothetical protein VARIO8X_160050 [Burkholderiales bacterium 8X]|nr:hypothetical protein VARIO8X_160050 [Burkholderiales bacterium 8X]
MTNVKKRVTPLWFFVTVAAS